MPKIAFVFSGQGAQYPGMGQSLAGVSPAVRDLYSAAEKIRPGISDLSFSGTAEELKQTVNTQPALYLVDLGAALALRENGIEADAAAGFSLGELPAMAYAGGVGAEEGFSLVTKRAEFMAAATMPGEPAMAAVMRLEPAVIAAICEEIPEAYPANFNAPEQTVISGTAAGIARFREILSERGIAARLVDLPVSGAFHTPYMAEAAERFAAVLAEADFKKPRIPVYSNRTGGPYPEDPAAYPGILAEQIVNPVRWVDEIRAMIEKGIDTFIECGAGKTLCGLIRKIDKSVAVYQAENAETLAETVKALKG